jgi:hypothetical protein
LYIAMTINAQSRQIQISEYAQHFKSSIEP